MFLSALSWEEAGSHLISKWCHLSRRISCLPLASPEGRAAVAIAIAREVQHFSKREISAFWLAHWDLALLVAVVEPFCHKLTSKAYTYSFMLFCSVLQSASSSHRNHRHMAMHLQVTFSTWAAVLKFRRFCCFTSAACTMFITPHAVELLFYGLVFWTTIMEISNT